jgi:hypothetical protein
MSGEEWGYRAEALVLITIETGLADASGLLEAAREHVRRRNRRYDTTSEESITTDLRSGHLTWVDGLEIARHDEFHMDDLRRYLSRLRKGPPPSGGSGGAPDAYDWEPYEQELRDKIKRDGLPGKGKGKNWQFKSDGGKFLLDCFTRDDIEPAPNESTCRKRAAKVMKNRE